MHHNYRCSPQQSYEVATTNIFDKLIPKSCTLQNVQPLANRGSVVGFGVENNHQGRI